MDQKSTQKREDGFTLVKLIAVIVIIVISAMAVLAILTTHDSISKFRSAKRDIDSIKLAVKNFKTDNGFYPSTEQGLDALVRVPTTGRIPESYQEGGYISHIPDDPWGTPYIYESPGSHAYDYEIVSLGADATPGGEDEDVDIESWNLK